MKTLCLPVRCGKPKCAGRDIASLYGLDIESGLNARSAQLERFESIPAWLALARTAGLGTRTAGKRVQAFGSPEAVFAASLTTLEAQHLPAAVAQAIHSRQPLRSAAKQLAPAQAC